MKFGHFRRNFGQSTPVIAMKSVSGASEYLAQMFERRQEGGPDDAGRKQVSRGEMRVDGKVTASAEGLFIMATETPV